MNYSNLLQHIYIAMYKVHMHAGAIRKLLYGCAYVREIILVVPGFGFVISD